jgi:peroxiredoxin Q/BCP
VFGISLDSVEDQARFHEAQELNFQLLSDPDGSAAGKYGVLPADASWTKRVTFVIDPTGVLRAIDGKVDVTSHGADLVELLRGLQQ